MLGELCLYRRLITTSDSVFLDKCLIPGHWGERLQIDFGIIKDSRTAWEENGFLREFEGSKGNTINVKERIVKIYRVIHVLVPISFSSSEVKVRNDAS